MSDESSETPNQRTIRAYSRMLDSKVVEECKGLAAKMVSQIEATGEGVDITQFFERNYIDLLARANDARF
ncbi:MAG: hypothetical protein NTW17_01880 [Candidatus Pacearchaeota archaeon]|nr:hypothetical protein [Candidatus Pacearchaeota archaeon]